MGILSKALVGFGKGLQQKATIDWDRIKEESRQESEKVLRDLELTARREENATQRDFSAEQAGLERDARASLNKDDNAAADRRNGAQIAASREDRAAAREDSATARSQDRQDRRIEREIDRTDKRAELERLGGVSPDQVRAAQTILREDPENPDALAVMSRALAAPPAAAAPEPLITRDAPAFTGMPNPTGVLNRAIGGGRAPGASGPAPGTVIDGMRFKGGNPNDQNNWERI